MKEKPLSKTDDCAAEFVMRALQGDTTRGIDVESLYCIKAPNGSYRWIIFELLKCDSVSVENSHPIRYWHINKGKFLALWSLCQCLDSNWISGELYLVNYDKDFEKVKQMRVTSMSVEGLETTDKIMTFEEWSEKYRALNKKAVRIWEVLAEKGLL